jgi:hypothetical protein
MKTTYVLGCFNTEKLRIIVTGIGKEDLYKREINCCLVFFADSLVFKDSFRTAQ